jgi:hypothetical protein
LKPRAILGVNPKPFTVIIKGGPPTITEEGLIPVIVGTTKIGAELGETDPPGFTTVIV